MSRVADIHEIENCFDGSFMVEFVLDQAVTERTMSRMATGAKLDYHKDFPRPYYRIARAHRYVIQGIIGNTTFRVTLSRGDTERAKNELVQLIEKEAEHGCEASEIL